MGREREADTHAGNTGFRRSYKVSNLKDGLFYPWIKLLFCAPEPRRSWDLQKDSFGSWKDTSAMAYLWALCSSLQIWSTMAVEGGMQVKYQVSAIKSSSILNHITYWSL